MHRTPLSPALVANWQYVILAGGPQSGDPGPSGSRKTKMGAHPEADKELIFRRQDILSAAATAARFVPGVVLRSCHFSKTLDLWCRYALPAHPAQRVSFGVGRYVVCRVTTEPGGVRGIAASLCGHVGGGRYSITMI